MKKFFSLLLVVTIILAICVPASATDEATVIYSYGSFESKTSNVFSGTMRRGYTYSEDYARTGSVSLKAVGSDEQSGGWLWINNGVTFEKGKKYSIRFYAMTDSGSATISAQFILPGNTYINASRASKVITVGSWSEHVTNFTWDSDKTEADILLKFGGEGNIYVDDLEIYEGTYKETIVPCEDVSFDGITPGSTAVNIYVDQNAVAGGNGSKTAPFNTIEAAQNYVETINGNMTKDIVVNIMGGTYEVSETIVLDDTDSGSNGHYVIYQPYGYGTGNQEEVVLSGGKKVTGWTESEIAGVYKAPLEIDYLRNLYVNDERAQRARYNEFVTPISWWDDTENTLSEKDGFVIPGGIIKDPEKATNLEVYRTATFRSNWAVRGTAAADGDNTIIKMEQPYFLLHELSNYSVLEWKITNNFRLENALEFLDEPGEWYHDADTDTLYYMPREGETIGSCEVFAPDTEELLNIGGTGNDNRAENIIVRGLTFSHGANKKTSRLGRANLQSTACHSADCGGSGYQGSQWTEEGNINIFNTKNVSFSDNVVSHMGSVGIAMPISVLNCEIAGNAIYDISSSAVTIGSHNQSIVSDMNVIPKNVIITNNIMSDTGVEYESSPAVQGYYTNNLALTHNEVINSRYSGICVGWDWNNNFNTKKNNTIAYNRIYNHGMACHDGGAIYTLGYQPDSVVTGNYIHSYDQSIVGIYHDEGSSGFTTTDNVVDMPADGLSAGLYHHSVYDELDITENYTNIINSTAGMSKFCDNFTAQGITRSSEALAIRAEAGLEDEYKNIRNKVGGYAANDALNKLYLQTKEQKHQTPANIEIGEKLTLKTLAEKRNGEISELTSGVTYQVGDASVLSLSGDTITAVAEGISTVAVTDAEGNSAMMTVSVGDEVVSCEIITDKESYKTNETVSLIYKLKTKYNEFVKKPSKSEISVSDESVLSVVTDGMIKALGEGVSTVSVNAEVCGFTVNDSIAVTVEDDVFRTFKKLKYNSLLSEDDILSIFGGDASATVTEEDFVNALAIITQLDSDEISENATTNVITNENMVAIAVDVLTEHYGVSSMGDSELSQYTDRADINPSLVTKIAMAYKYGLLSWMETSLEFQPDKEITAGDATALLYRFARPEKLEYLRKDETRLSTYTTLTEWLTTRNYPERHSKIAQWNMEASGEECVEITNTVHNGSGGVAIVDGELVQKVTRSSTLDHSILLVNNVDFIPGKTYTLSFAAKLSKESGLLARNKNTLSISPHSSAMEPLNTVSGVEITPDSWTTFSMGIKIADDSEYPIPAVKDENGTTVEWNSIYISLRNLSYDTHYYDVYFKDLVITEMTDTKIASSSIANGEENVTAPIKEVYLYTGSAIDTTTVSADKFTITGDGASISSAVAIDDRTICVGIDGCTYGTAYTLSVSGIDNFSGGTLNDSISWTTAERPTGKTGIMDFEENVNGFSGSSTSEIASVACSTEQKHAGEQSAKITTIAHGNIFVNSRYIGFDTLEVGKKYHASYRIYSPDKTMRTGIYKFSSAGSASNVAIVPYTSITKGEWHYISGTFTITEQSQCNDVFVMAIFDNPGTCYVDDFKVSEVKEYPITVYRPNVLNDGIPISQISEGNISVNIDVTGGDTDASLYTVVAQYDDNDRLVRAISSTDTVAASADETIVINLPDAQNLRTKIMVMDGTTFAPYNVAISMGKTNN